MLQWSDSNMKQSYHESKGTVVMVLDKTEGWTKIYIKSQVGWVSNTLVEQVTPVDISRQDLNLLLSGSTSNDFKSCKWLNKDEILFTEHGGEGSQEVRFGKYEDGALLLYGNPEHIYTNSAQEFSIEKMGDDPYSYYNLNYGEAYKCIDASGVNIGNITEEEAEKVKNLFSDHVDYKRYYFTPNYVDEATTLISCDIVVEGDEGAPTEFYFGPDEMERAIRTFVSTLDKNYLPKRLAANEAREKALKRYFSDLKEIGLDVSRLYFSESIQDDNGYENYQIMGFKYAKEDAVLFVSENYEGLDFSQASLRQFFYYDLVSKEIIQLNSLPGIDISVQGIVDFNGLSGYPSLVKEINNCQDFGKHANLMFYEDMPDLLKVSADFNYFLNEMTLENLKKSESKITNSLTKVYYWDGSTFREKTFTKERFGSFAMFSETEQKKLKAACKASEEFEAYGQLDIAFLDVDMDGTPEIFVKDEEDNKALCIKKGNSYEISNLGIYKSSVTIMPNIISVETSAGTGVTRQMYKEIRNSSVTKIYNYNKEYDIQKDTIKIHYLDCTQEEVETFSKNIDNTNVIHFYKLNWIPI